MYPNQLPKILLILLAMLQLAACGGGGGGDSSPSVTRYDISASSEPATGGEVRGTGSYRSGALYTLTAVPEPGFVFRRWEEGGNVIATAQGRELVGTAGGNRSVTAVFVEMNLNLAPQSLELQIGETAQITASLTAEGVDSEDVTPWIEWTSSDPGVASVNDSGQVTGHAEGATNIVAQFGGRVASVTIEVLPANITGLRFVPDSVTLVTGENYTPVLLASYDSGPDRPLALDQITSWVSSSSEIADFGDGLIEAGMVAGTTTITASRDGQQAELSVVVENADLNSIEITAPGLGADQSLQLTVGDQIQFSATGNFSNNESRDITDRVSWATDDPALAISSNFPDFGLASAMAAEPADVTATLDGIESGIVLVTIAADPLAPASVSLSVTGDDAVRWSASSPPSVNLNSLIRNSNGDPLTRDANVTYTVVSGPLVLEGGELSLAEVTSQGASSVSAKATGPGTATISARVEGTSLVSQRRVYIVNDFSEVIIPSRSSSTVTVNGEERLRIRFSLFNLSNVAVPVTELKIRVPDFPEVMLTSPEGSGPNFLPFSAVPGRSVVGQGILFNLGTTGIEADYVLRNPDMLDEFEVEL